MVSAQLDQVLHFNTDAIARLKRLLECSCAKSGHRILVYASIFSRILIWYQQAAGLNGVASHVSIPSSSTGTPDNSTTKPAMLSQATGFAVDKSPISVGTFNVEDQDLQATIRVQLVLSELKNIADVIQVFTTHDSGEVSEQGVSSLYQHLGAWLQSELSRMASILRQRLRKMQTI